MDSSPIYFSLVIPAYNEAQVIEKAVLEADEALGSLGYSYEILIVDDGSSDGTAALAERAAETKPQVKVLHHQKNIGYGAALRTGFSAAKGELLSFTDADCQFDLHELGKMIPLTQKAAIVAGYRINRRDNWSRRFFSRGYNLLARALLGTQVRDCDCALKVFRREALQRLSPASNGFFINTEMLTRARQLELQITEVGVHHRPRFKGQSKVTFAEIPKTLKTFLPFWWSQVLFPKVNSKPSDHETTNRSTLIFQTLILLFFSALLFFTRLSCPLLEPEEARYAEIPRQMLATGNFAVPVIHGEVYLHKPPLMYWLVMGAYQVFGVDDWGARLVPGVIGVLIICLVYWWGRKVVGNTGAFVAGLILCLSARFVYLARMITLDNLLCLCVLASLLAAFLALAKNTFRWHWLITSAVACGLGILTKGPVGVALIIVPVLTFQFLDQRVEQPKANRWLAFGLITFLVAAPWYVFLACYDWQRLINFFWFHNVLRFLTPFDHAKPFWFFLPGLMFGMLPWSLLLFPLFRFLARKDAGVSGKREAGLGFVLISFLWCVFFFSCSGCKRSIYILSAIPPLALVMGGFLSKAFPWRSLFQSKIFSVPVPAIGERLARQTTLAVLIVYLTISYVAVEANLWSVSEAQLAGTMLIGIALFVLFLLPKMSGTAIWTSCFLVMFTLQLGAIQQLLPKYNRRFALRGLVRRQADLARQSRVPVMCYPKRWDSVSFYLRRHDVRAFNGNQLHRMIEELKAQPKVMVVVRADQSLQQFLEKLPNHLEWIPSSHQRRGVCLGIIRNRKKDK